MTPRSTYRIQLRDGVGLADLEPSGVLDHVARLGVTHLYLSPILRAAPGSTHGYDVVDPEQIDPELGGAEAFDALREAAARRGLGLVLDIVPNHLAADPRANRWWWDVLRRGPASPYARFFDIEWHAAERRLEGKVLLPVLGDHLGREIERGAFRLEERGDDIVVVHPSVTAPLSPESVENIRARVAVSSSTLEEELDRIAADPDALDALLGAQHHRLSRWQAGIDDLGYRRFFDITTLVGARVEDHEVFEATHRLVLELVRTGAVDGLRVDHPDGLRDPAGYFEHLRSRVGDRWIVVEKILEPGERLRAWPVAGTTGYEVAELVDRLFVDDAGRAPFESLAERVAGRRPDVEGLVREAKAAVTEELLGPDVHRVTDVLVEVAEAERRYRDFSRRELRAAVVAAVVAMPVYRTYVAGHGPADPEDVAVVDETLGRARGEHPELDPELFGLLRHLMVDELPPGGPEADFRARFQQLTGPAMAKGKEDTAWYRLPTLLSRVDVGSDPDAWGLPLADFHAAMEELQRDHPDAMTSLSTHDSKRSEDTRAVLTVLSERAGEWAESVEEWCEVLSSSGEWRPDDGAVALSLFQLVLATWRPEPERIREQARKAAREAKERTSWLAVDEEYEAHLDRLVDTLLGDPAITEGLDRWAAELVVPARTTSLARKAIQLMAPGVPDLYQGSERWLARLVDPDNRFAYQVPPELPAAMPPLGEDDEGAAKERLVRAVLGLRNAEPDCFSPGSYAALWARGPFADHVVGFLRGERTALVAPRRVLAVADGFGDTTVELPEGTWTDAVTGASRSGDVAVDDLLAEFPVAVLRREAG